MTRYTVFGGRGFVGSHLVNRLGMRGDDVFVPTRDWEPTPDQPGGTLGTVIYAIGVTADFRRDPLSAVEAHVSKLARILEHGKFDRFVYLSSARIYRDGPTDESTPISADPRELEHLYDLSKLLGESTVLNATVNGAVVRLSNVFGADWASENMITAVLRDAVLERHVTLRSDPDSEKDFVGVEDVTRAILDVADRGEERIYNVASGSNTRFATILDAITQELGATWDVATHAPLSVATPISIDRLRQEFNYAPTPLEPRLSELAKAYALHRVDR